MHFICAQRVAGVLLNISVKFWRISSPDRRAVGYRAGPGAAVAARHQRELPALLGHLASSQRAAVAAAPGSPPILRLGRTVVRVRVVRALRDRARRDVASEAAASFLGESCSERERAAVIDERAPRGQRVTPRKCRKTARAKETIRFLGWRRGHFCFLQEFPSDPGFLS